MADCKRLFCCSLRVHFLWHLIILWIFPCQSLRIELIVLDEYWFTQTKLALGCPRKVSFFIIRTDNLQRNSFSPANSCLDEDVLIKTNLFTLPIRLIYWHHYKISLRRLAKTYPRYFWTVLLRRLSAGGLPRSHFWEIYGQCTKFPRVIKVLQVLVSHFTTF